MTSLLCFHVLAPGTSATPVKWDLAALQAPPKVFAAPAGVEIPEGVHAVCFEGLPWRGQATRVFAYYGVPAGANKNHPVPGIVLIHGAGGTAFSHWVRQWVDRGYAAIAFDHDGGLPIGKYDAWVRNPQGGPNRGDIAQLPWPVADQWMYHAVADTLLAHSLLASLDGVDAHRIGATGISWGAVILCNVAGVDPRLKFAIPVYGCGFISEESVDGSTFVGQKGTSEQRAAWHELWDPAHFLPHAKLPMLWLSGTNDFAFTMRAWQQSYRLPQGLRTLCLRVRMPHTHGPASEDAAEIQTFADSIVKDGLKTVQIMEQNVHSGTASVTFASPKPLNRAELNFTRDSGRWQDRTWESVPANLEGNRASALVPPKATVYYFNLIDDRGQITSSKHIENASPSVAP